MLSTVSQGNACRAPTREGDGDDASSAWCKRFDDLTVSPTRFPEDSNGQIPVHTFSFGNSLLLTPPKGDFQAMYGVNESDGGSEDQGMALDGIAERMMTDHEQLLDAGKLLLKDAESHMN